MTRPLRDSDRQRIVQRAVTTFGRLTRVGHSVSHVRATMDREMDDGLRGTDYSVVKVSGAAADSHPERMVSERADQAWEDMERLDHSLRLLEQAEAIAWPILDRRDPMTLRKPGDTDPDKRKPDKRKAPAHCCTTCWRHGREEPAGERWSGECDICGRFLADHGERMNAPLWRIRHEQGKARLTTGDLRAHAPHLLNDVTT